MERSEAAPAPMTIHQFFKTFLHLSGCCFRKSYHQDGRRVNLVVLNQIFHPVRDHCGLARTRTSQHKHRAISVLDRLQLGRMKCHIFLPAYVFLRSAQ